MDHFRLELLRDTGRGPGDKGRCNPIPDQVIERKPCARGNAVRIGSQPIHARGGCGVKGIRDAIPRSATENGR